MIFQFTFAPSNWSLRILHQFQIILLSRPLDIRQWFQHLSGISVYGVWCFGIEPWIVDTVVLSFSLVLNCVELFLRDAHAGVDFVCVHHVFGIVVDVLSDDVHCTLTMFHRHSRHHRLQLINVIHYISTFFIFSLQLFKQLLILND